MKNVHAGISKGSAQPIFYYKCLFFVGVVIFLNIILADSLNGVVYRVINQLCIIPCILFLEFAREQGIHPAAKEKLRFCLAIVIWFVIVEALHSEVRQLEERTIGIYMMAFPFAAVVRDEKIGLKLIAKLFIAATLVLIGYTIVLLMDILPDSTYQYLHLAGARLFLLRHANVTACIFMLGIGFSLMLLLQEEKKWRKCLLLAIAVAQFIVLTLTNCRTSVVFTCALIGGLVFFYVCRSGWKHFLIGAISALLVMIAVFAFSNATWKIHNDVVIAKQDASQMQDLSEDMAFDPAAEKSNSNSGEIILAAKAAEMAMEEEPEDSYSEQKAQLEAEGGQGSFLSDLWTLNSRTRIWKNAIQSIKDDPSILLWGTPNIGMTISDDVIQVGHTHNSWLNVLMGYGIPGLLGALILTWVTVRNAAILLLNQKEQLWKKTIALLLLCVMGHSFLEPFLFFADTGYFIVDFAFLLCTGYLSFWVEKPSEETDF